MPSEPSARPALAALLFFLASHASVAFLYRPNPSDTSLYSLYAFVTGDAIRLGRSPYDHFERLKRESAAARGLAVQGFDEVTLEYPPLALGLMLAPLSFVAKDPAGLRGMGQHDAADWVRGFRMLYFLAHASLVVAMAVWLRRKKLVSSPGLVVATLGGSILAFVLYDRLDLWLGLILLGGLGALVTGRRYLALALLAVAVDFKLVPVVLVPLFLLGTLPVSVLTDGFASRRALRALALACAVLGAACLAAFLPFRLLWGPRVWDFLAYHSERGFQIESTWSSLVLVAAQLGYPAEVVHAFGADGVVGPGLSALAKVSSLVTLAVVCLAYWFLWRALQGKRAQEGAEPARQRTLAQERPQLFVWGAFAVLALAIASSKVFSPQYLCWLLPCFLLVERPRDGRAAAPLLVFLVACGLTAVIFPGLWWTEVVRPVSLGGKTALLLPTLRATLVMLSRNLAWIGFCVLAIARMRASIATPEPEAVPGMARARKRRHRR